MQQKSKIIIYNYRNLVNGKRYIGRSIQGAATRNSEHMWEFRHGDRSRALYAAFAKYGVENFVLEVICTALDKSYLDELERHFIKEYDTYRNGYNMTEGGDTPELTPEVRAKIAVTLTGGPRTYKDPATRYECAYRAWETRRKNLAEDPTCYKDMRTVSKRGKDHPQAKRYLVRFPDGTKHIIKGLGQFCRDNGLDEVYFRLTLTRKKWYNKGYKMLAIMK